MAPVPPKRFGMNGMMNLALTELALHSYFLLICRHYAGGFRSLANGAPNMAHCAGSAASFAYSNVA